MSELPSRQDILDYIARNEGKTSKRDISKAFNIKGQNRIGLKQILRNMATEGLLDGNRKEGFRKQGDLPNVGMILVTGKDRDGELHGRVILHGETLEAPDVIISNQRKPPFPGDQVLARLKKIDDKNYEASVIRRISSAGAELVIGVFHDDESGARLEPSDKRERYDFQITNLVAGVQNGDLVVCEKMSGNRRDSKKVRIKEVICAANEPGAFSLIALAEQGIPLNFTEDVLAEADKCQDIELDIKLSTRTDMRDLPLITIDPADARDHDDAVFAQTDSNPDNAGGYHVYVAIADVSAHIKPFGQMDMEARKRGNSVYLPDRVVPMLPEKISNNLCSLRPDEDRPSLVVQMTIDKHGKTKKHEFFRALIRSKARLSYQQAQLAFDGAPDEDCLPIYETVLQPLWQAYLLMAKARDNRQPLALDLPERKVVMNDKGEIVDIFTPERLEAMRVIEEMMVTANVCAAQTLEKHNTPLVYRIHDAPDPDRLHALADFVRPLGVAIDLGQPMIPRLFNHILHGAKQGEHAFMVQEAVLRTQSQAKYTPDNIGHFGLALSSYAHFTSPIRRYADLIVHRALIRALKLGDDGLADEDIAELHPISEHISQTERRAMMAERSAKDRYLSAYMADRIDEVFDGRVSGVSTGGLFVKLNETGGDGFIPISRLGAERFVKDDDGMMLVGGTTGLSFKIGEALRVRLIEATPIKGGLLLSLAEGGDYSQAPRKGERGERRERGGRGGRGGRAFTGKKSKSGKACRGATLDTKKPKSKSARDNVKGKTKVKIKKSNSRAGRRRAKANMEKKA